MEGGSRVVGDVISSQIADHSPFGGVVPELASRKHQEALLPLLRALFVKTGVSRGDIGLIAVTAGPGLMGSLLVGVMSAKALSQGWGAPLIAVNHLEGHMYANIISHPELRPPFLCLIVSGGHTEVVLARGLGEYSLLGGTRDDAAGEAYDKASKMLGLGYPGGPAIERMAAGGDPWAFAFPVAMRDSGEVEFSFSGINTSLRTALLKMKGEIPLADVCASFQRTMTESLLLKLEIAAERTGVGRVTVSGGVAANADLRYALTELGRRKGFDVFLPPKKYCTDNAIMIAAAGYASYARGLRSDLSLTPNPSWKIWT